MDENAQSVSKWLLYKSFKGLNRDRPLSLTGKWQESEASHMVLNHIFILYRQVCSKMEENSGLSTSPNINSVLKPPKPRVPLRDIMAVVHDEENTADRKRRVSFANVNKIKEFSAGAESMVVCHTPAYEEPFYLSSDSSYPSGADGLTPAKNMSADSNNSQGFIYSEQKKQFPIHLNRDNYSLSIDDDINEKLLFQNLQRQSIPKRVSGLLVQDNNTVFATSNGSFDAMDLTKCIDNRRSIARNSTRFSMGMDLTECIDNHQGTARNSTKFSVGMDLTECVDHLNATTNATRFSLGKSLNTSEGMDLTKAVISHEPYSDQISHQLASCTNSSDVASLDDSNALELTDAINDPRFSVKSMLYSVSNTGVNKNTPNSVPDKTRYSLSGMDLTKAAILNCSAARRKSTRYSLSNMDLTEVVKASDCSGLDFTEVIDDPKIMAMSTRYSLNEVDLTNGLINKDTSFPENSTQGSEVDEDKLDYSACSETSMDFTKPIHNILQSHEQTHTLLNDMKTKEITDGKKSFCSTEHIKIQDINVIKDFNESSNKTNESAATDHTLNCLGRAETSLNIQDEKEILISEPPLFQELNCSKSNLHNTQTVFQTKAIDENVCTAVAAKQFPPTMNHMEELIDKSVTDSSKIEEKELSLASTSNSPKKINILTSSCMKAKTTSDFCYEESMQLENNNKTKEIPTLYRELQEFKANSSDTNINSDEYQDVEEKNCENMDVSDVDSSQIVQSNFVSKSGSISKPFSKELALITAEEASKSFSLENQLGNLPTGIDETMEISDFDNTNKVNGSQDLSFPDLPELNKTDCANVCTENLHVVEDKDFIKPSRFEDHSKLNISVSSITNELQLNEKKCNRNHVESEPVNVEVKKIRTYDVSTSLENTDLIRSSAVEEGKDIELKNNFKHSLNKDLSSSESKMLVEVNLDNSLNASQKDDQLRNISYDESLMLVVEPTEDNNTLFMNNFETNESNKVLQQSFLNEGTSGVGLNLSSDTLANVSTNNTLCSKNITMTRGGATAHSTIFSMSHSLTETSENEDSLIEYNNMEHTSLLEYLPLVQRIAMGGDTTQKPDEEKEKRETSDAIKTNPQKGGKRSFEEALKPEDDTKESPLKQLCLSKGDCDLLINVTAPSFLMDTMSAPNETFHHVSDVTLKSSTAVSPFKNESSVEVTVSKKSFFENIDLNDSSASFVQKRNFDHVCRNSFSLRVDISTEHDSSKIVVREDKQKTINVERNEHIEKTTKISEHPVEQKCIKTVGIKRFSASPCKTVEKSYPTPESPMRFEPTHYTIKSRRQTVANGPDLYNKHKDQLRGVGNEEHQRIRHSMALPKLTSSSQQKEMDILSKNKRIKHLGGRIYLCDIIPKWIEFHFVADSSGNILNPSYKIICSQREQAVGDYMLQQVKACQKPLSASDLLTQLQGSDFARLAVLARSLSFICKYNNGKLKGNVLTIELMNCKKHFWFFVDINLKYPQNLTMTDVTLSQQKLGEFKLASIRQIFDTIKKSPEQLLQFASELAKLHWQ